MEYGLSLGSNLDDKVQHLRDAYRALASHPDIQLLCSSALYETEPVDVQPEYADMPFVNAAIVLESSRPPTAMLKIINDLETKLGRVREADRNAPRTIDIDILYAGEQLIDSGGLTVPHPRWAERAFVVVPLAEIRPNLTLPGARLTVANLLKTLTDVHGVKKLPVAWT